MTTVLQYLVIAAVIGLLLFGIALLLFGRGERLSALPARTSPAQLPERGIEGADVRRVRFALALRGYRMSDVDWTLDRLADELDRTRQQLAQVTAPSPDGDQYSPEPLLPVAEPSNPTGQPGAPDAPARDATPPAANQPDATPTDATPHALPASPNVEDTHVPDGSAEELQADRSGLAHPAGARPERPSNSPGSQA